MEVEVKLRLSDTPGHQWLSDALAPHLLHTHLQDNLFFDGTTGQLTARLTILHLRFYDGDSYCILSLKACARVAGGVSHIEEDKEEIDHSLGCTCATEPWRLDGLAGSSQIMGRIKDEFGLASKQRRGWHLGFFYMKIESRMRDWGGRIRKIGSASFRAKNGGKCLLW